MNIRKIFLFLMIIICCIVLTACENKNENIEAEKVFSEVEFLQNQCINIVLKYISNDYQKADNQFDFEKLKEDYFILESSIDVVIIDFASIQIPSSNIVELNNNFNDLNICIQNEDTEKFVEKICDIYSVLSNSILDNISKDEVFKQEKKAKSYLVYTGFYLTNSNKEKALENLGQYQNSFAIFNKNHEYIENNSYKINKVFVDIQKLRAQIESENFNGARQTFQTFIEIF